MKKQVFIFIFLIICHIVWPETGDRITINGTKCSMIPPEGFQASTAFSGFQNEEYGASIMINEFPASYSLLSAGFSEKALKSKGMSFLSSKTIELNGSEALLLKVSQPANGIMYLKQILIFGDSEYTVLINGIYPDDFKEEIEQDIQKALLSTVYSIEQDDDPLDAVLYSIDTSGSDFKLAHHLSGTLIYTIGGEIPTQKPVLIVGNSLNKVAPDKHKEFAEARIKELPGAKDSEIKKIEPIIIDNLNGYEVVAENKGNSNTELIYQVILFTSEGDYFIVLGQAKENFETNLQLFKKIALTFKLKP